jgi:hypothetical protein
MSLLEDLQKQAKQQREKDELAEEERRRLQSYYREVTRPAAGRIYQYLRELTEHLNYLKTSQEITYNIPRYGLIRGRIEPAFRLTVSKDDEQATTKLETTAEIPLETSPEVFLDNGQLVEDMDTFVLERGLSAKKIARRNQQGDPLSASFQIYGHIKMTCLVECVWNQPTFEMHFTNFDTLGTVSRAFSPEIVDDEFLDRLGRYIVRQNDSFIQAHLSDEEREKMREEIRRRRREGGPKRERDPDERGLLERIGGFVSGQD